MGQAYNDTGWWSGVTVALSAAAQQEGEAVMYRKGDQLTEQ